MKLLWEFSHTEEALALFITSNQLNNADFKMDMKLVSANSLMFVVLQKSCVNDEFIMTEIWNNRNTCVNHLLKLLSFHDLNSMHEKWRNIWQVWRKNQLWNRWSKEKSNWTTQFGGFDMLLNGIRFALSTTYLLVREISLVPCVHITALIQRINIMLTISRNQ